MSKNCLINWVPGEKTPLTKKKTSQKTQKTHMQKKLHKKTKVSLKTQSGSTACMLLSSMTLIRWTKLKTENENRSILNDTEHDIKFIKHFCSKYSCLFRCLSIYRRQNCLREGLSHGRSHRGPLHLYGGKWWVSNTHRQEFIYTTRVETMSNFQ